MAEEFAKGFATSYYDQFDRDRTGLATLYRDSSVLTFEGVQHVGVAAIVAKLKDLNERFSNVKHQVGVVDAQPTSTTPPGLFVLVTGLLIVDDGNPLQFSQAFHLIQEGENITVANDVFRLVYG
ncbi:hypothetical protein M422DRAFT_228252 [Sphaerobolus stellatus SS14]|uniref:Nuclear transport factor 2 n=1 Tax=Sphaerobolus stellatus (strain SS14) TaxID=990650 RepID=A0A0C9VYV3_SPHS4|nr:hypothetical protein M422DRAFT_228252 [Sphaerobolus stellatus SS14]